MTTLPEEAVKDALFTEMTRRFDNDRYVWETSDDFHPNPEYLPTDDTQIGVEFAYEFLKPHLTAALPFLSALEPSALDMGNPITDKTVKMVLAEAIAQVWYQTRDCDVEEIDRIIAHLNRNGLLIVGIQRFKMMADAIQSAAAYLALSQPNSAEKLIADLDAALNGETAHVNQLSGISGLLIESLINDADWLGEYGHQMHEESEYHDGGYTANRLQAIGDRISKLLETGIPATEPSAARDLALEEAANRFDRIADIINRNLYHQQEKIKDAQYIAAEGSAAIRALSSPDHADAGKVEGDGWLPIESAPNHEQGPFLVTNNPKALNAFGRPSHVWCVGSIHKDDDGSFCAFDGYRKIHDLKMFAVVSAPSEGAE